MDPGRLIYAEVCRKRSGGFKLIAIEELLDFTQGTFLELQKNPWRDKERSGTSSIGSDARRKGPSRSPISAVRRTSSIRAR